MLTTQILTEAEELCDDILIINQGRQVARGDLHTLKLLVDRLYDVTLTFDACRTALDGAAGRLPAPRASTVIAQHRAASRSGTRRRGCWSSSRRWRGSGRVLRIEIGGASLEDIFVELTQQQTGGDR